MGLCAMASADLARPAQEKIECSSDASTDVVDLGVASPQSGSEVDATDSLEQHVNADVSLETAAVPQGEKLPFWPVQQVQEQGAQAAPQCGAFVLVPMAALQQQLSQLQAAGFVVGQPVPVPQAWGVGSQFGPQRRPKGKKKERKAQREDPRVEAPASSNKYVPPHRRQAVEAPDVSARRRYERRAWPERPHERPARGGEQRGVTWSCWAERPQPTSEWREQSGASECDLGPARWPWPKMLAEASSEELADQQEGVELLLAALQPPGRAPWKPATGAARVATAAVDRLRRCLVECTGGSAPPAEPVPARRRLPPPPAGPAPAPPED